MAPDKNLPGASFYIIMLKFPVAIFDVTCSGMENIRIKSTLRIVFIFVFIVLVNTGAKSQTIRIMPLGNSITAGSMCTNGDIHSCVPLGGNNAVGYRQKLSNLLTASGYNFDFVGSETYGNSLMSDADCAGFGGISDSRLADVMETGTSTHTGYVSSGPYMNSYPADIVLLHIGTNDVLAADTAWTDIPRILDAIDDYETANNTTVTVFLARIISTRYADCWTNPRVIAYNKLIDNLAASRIAGGDQLILVDMECAAGIDYDNDFTDQVHPNQSGYDKMGEAWFAAIDAWSPPTGPTYSLTMEPSIGNGTTSPAEGAHNYAQGSSVTLTATAADGYIFTGWSGDLTGDDNPASILLNGNKNISATFEQRSYDLTLITDGTAGAEVQPAGTVSVGHGTQTTISVSSIPEGSSFDAWVLISGSSVSIANPSSQSTTVKLESGSATVQANFTSVTHSVKIDITGEGTVGKAPDLVNYPENSVVSLTALPANGHHFVKWTGDVSGTTNPANLLMDGEKGLRATFQKSTYQLTVSTDGTAGSAVNPAGTVTVDHGALTSISVSQVPEAYVFDGWELSAGSLVLIADPSSLSTTVKLESGNGTVQANFASSSHSISIAIVGEGSVAKTPDLADYTHNSVLSLAASPESGYHFVGWTGDLVGESNPSDVLMDENKEITASFEKLSYELTVITDGTSGAVVDPTGAVSVNHGDETVIRVIQVPENRIFDGWEIISGSSVTINDPSSQSSTVRLENGDASIQANFIDSTALGIFNGINETERLLISPNPAMDYISIKQINYAGQSNRILVIDMNGQQVISQKIEGRYPKLQIEIAALLPGIYVVHCILDSGEVIKGKFVKLN